jgi:hypothetical protein
MNAFTGSRCCWLKYIESLVRSPTHHNTISVEVGLTSRFLGKLVKLIFIFIFIEKCHSRFNQFCQNWVYFKGKKGLKSPYLKQIGSCIVAITTTLQIKYRHLVICFFFSRSLWAIEIYLLFHFRFLIFNFAFWRNFARKKKADLCLIRN